MRRFLLNLLPLIALAACQHPGSSRPVLPLISWTALNPQLAYAPAYIELSDAKNGGFTSNVSWLQAGAQTWLIGSGSSEAVAKALMSGLNDAKLTQPNHILSPRAHPESVLGAGFIPNAQHLALPEVAAAMKNRCPECAARFRQAIDPQADPAKIGLPSPLLHSTAYTSIQFIPLQRAPGEWTTAVRSGLTLITPGLIWGRGITPDLREAQIASLQTSLQSLRHLTHEQSVIHIIPEQGAADSAELIELNAAYWRVLDREICTAVSLGKNLNEWPSQASPSLQAVQNHSKNAFQTTFNEKRHSLNAQKLWLFYENEMFKKPVFSC